ncbi:MAG TPA: BadF/BadG/BcrA/BcrD ATPase family protein [Desulfobacterales bacterium]|nr:BadF/BadG/BcrA/BcrD ATPase family protein [Desulfobacterales bacterium]
MTPSKEELSAPDGALYVGIDAGSVSVNAIVIDEQKRIVYASPYSRHFGKVEESVAALLGDLDSRFGRDRITGVAFTGSHGRQLSEQAGAPYEFAIVSQLLGAVHVAPQVRTVISMGGQETALLQVAHRDSGWELENFSTNGPCASGTGSFIDQQAERLAMSIYERRGDRERPPIDGILADFIALGLESRRAASVACRCTVFTKSDMIHLQNKGERLEDIIHGLHVGNARSYISSLVASRVLHDPILFIGGLTLNQLQVQALRAHYPRLIVPPPVRRWRCCGAARSGADNGRAAPAPAVG